MLFPFPKKSPNKMLHFLETRLDEIVIKNIIIVIFIIKYKRSCLRYEFQKTILYEWF